MTAHGNEPARELHRARPARPGARTAARGLRPASRARMEATR